MQAVIVVASTEPGQKDLPLVLFGIKYQIPVYIGVDEKIGWLRDHHYVVKDRHPERGLQEFLLDENMGLVRLAIGIGILEDHNTVTLPVPPGTPVVDPFRHPGASVVIKVDIGRITEER
jgi:hypothetical protein